MQAHGEEGSGGGSSSKELEQPELRLELWVQLGLLLLASEGTHTCRAKARSCSSGV